MRVDRGRGMQGSGKSESGNGGISYLITNKYSTRLRSLSLVDAKTKENPKPNLRYENVISQTD